MTDKELWSMWLKYRIRKLQAKVDIQAGHLREIRKSEDRYENSYYTDKFLSEHLKWLEMNSKLKYLKEKLDAN